MKLIVVTAVLLLLVLSGHRAEAQIHRHATLVTYNGLTQYGRNNRDAIFGALARLGITGFDTLDRNAFGSASIDYTRWCTVIWSSGDPTVSVVTGEATGQSGLSLKEIGEVERFLSAGRTLSKKSLIMAGQNIAFEHSVVMPNGGTIDTDFLHSYMHTKFVANSPASNTFVGKLIGGYSDYWQFSDSIDATSPDVIKPAKSTPLVGPEVNWFAYSYEPHSSPDSGAGVTYYNPLCNIVFYGFDWADPFITTPPEESGSLTSGTTRVLKGALDFVTSHAQSIQCILDGVTSLSDQEIELGEITSNPAAGRARIDFQLVRRSFVTLQILDVAGRTIRTVFADQRFDAGKVERTLDVSELPNGPYFYELIVTDEVGNIVRLSRKMAIEK